MQKNQSFLRGIYRDILLDRHGQVIFDRGFSSNTIVDNGRILLAGFMKNDPKGPKAVGIEYMAVGQGAKEWSDTDPPPPLESTNKLETPYKEKTPSPIIFPNWLLII